MKKTLPIIVFAAVLSASLPAFAATTLYTEDWGSSHGSSASLGNIGWTLVTPAANNPPYEGIYQAGGATDASSGTPLPTNTVYFTGMTAGQVGMFYTTAGLGTGADGDSAFTAIDPTQFKSVTLSVEATDEGSTATNYFAVQVGGAWYVSATSLAGSDPAYPQFALSSTPYTTTASAWNQLTVGSTVTIGSAATANLSGPITGVGIVQVGPGGWNYNEILITATPSPTVYTEDWGSSHGSAANLGNIGWTLVTPAANNPPYEGIFQAGGATDASSGAPLPTNTVYYTTMTAGEVGMFYTTAGAGAGTDGDSAFNAIDPTEHTGLTLSIEASDENTAAANYFAVQVGGAWYVSTTALVGSAPAYPQFALSSTPYTTAASAWDQLTVGSTVTIGPVATANLSGPITGIGIVQVGPGGWNYNELIVSASVPSTVAAPLATIYSEDWGTPAFNATGTQNGAADVADVGWSSSGIAYTGSYAANGSIDPGTGVTFPPPTLGNINGTNNALYASLDQASDIGIFYTTDTNGPGTIGDSTFNDINPANYPGGVILNIEAQFNSATLATDYFAVKVAGNWYVSTDALTNYGTNGFPIFLQNSLTYNSGSNNWDTLSFTEGPVNATGPVTIGGTATNNLTGDITGVGVVVVGQGSYAGGTTGYGVNHSTFSITTPLVNSGSLAPKIDAAGFSQTTYATGTTSFAVDAFVGTAPATYTWSVSKGGAPTALADGATGTGSFIIGANSNILTISNVGSSDVGTYSVEVANLYGGDNSSNYVTNTLTVNPVPNDVLYAEIFPFTGPFPTGESPTQDGWFATVGSTDNPNRLDESGSLYAYENTATTTGFFTSSATDVPELSGLPFTNINPANFSFVSFRAGIANPTANNASVYFAVEMTGGQWYVSSSAIQLASVANEYNTYGLQFSTAAAEWNALTVGSSSATIGASASADLTGDIIGAGLVFAFTGTAEYDVNYFALVTDSTPPVLATFPSEPDVPYPQTVYAGGGASFFFTEAGTLPLTNNWQFNDNGVDLTDGVTPTGSIISGSQTTEITIQNVSAADAGTYDPTVSDPAGTANVDGSEYGPPPLTVIAPPVGLIYNESFPLYKPIPSGGANQPLGIIGWTNQSDTPARVFQIGTALEGQGAAYAYEGVQTNSLFYASTTSDTGFSGLPFVAFDPADYPAGSIGFSVSMEAGNAQYTNASASFAVEQGGQWYVMATAVQPTNDNNLSTTAYTVLGPQVYSPLASQWKTLTFSGTAGVSVGGAPAQNLSGPITAAGLLFQHFGTSGADLNYDSFTIQATGSGSLMGGLSITPMVTSGQAILTWIGNPAVFLQSSTDLIHWVTIPNTQGNHMTTVSAAGSHVFYRLAGPLP